MRKKQPNKAPALWLCPWSYLSNHLQLSVPLANELHDSIHRLGRVKVVGQGGLHSSLGVAEPWRGETTSSLTPWTQPAAGGLPSGTCRLVSHCSLVAGLYLLSSTGRPLKSSLHDSHPLLPFPAHKESQVPLAFLLSRTSGPRFLWHCQVPSAPFSHSACSHLHTHHLSLTPPRLYLHI